MASLTAVLLPLLLVVLTVAGVLRCADASGSPFNYLEAGDDWLDTNKFPDSQCGGQSQSPINIIPNDVVEFDDAIVAKVNTAGIVDDATRTNIGQTLEVEFSTFTEEPDLQLPLIDGAIVGVAREPDSVANDDDDDVTFVSALPTSFHFHIPSENTINGIYFPMEAHLVTRVSQDQVSYCPTGGCFAVFATLFQLDLMPNTFLSRIFQGIETMALEKPQDISGPVSIDGLLPDDKEKFVYWNGSLTTPNCNENVTWILFQDVQTVSQDQIVQLQQNFGLRRTKCQSDAGNDIEKILECNNVGDLRNNRPTQPLNGRRVFSSEEDEHDSSEIVSDILKSNSFANAADSRIRRAFLSF